uniref:ATR interacting protein n=1 Tax=Tetraodon nigroviridis TaxID=99883 RepID=H3CD54_TETNG
MNCPPFKRQKRLNDDVPRAVTSEDPFGDDEDFTQDDLDEIDVIASQAFPQGAPAGLGAKLASSGPYLTRTSWWSLGEETSALRANSRHATINRPQSIRSDLKDAHSLLEVQHAELKRKLKEVEEEIMLKNGEIRLLRDSLKGAQQEKEAQRQAQMLLDVQRHKEQSHKEKELHKKVLALQTELQFKEAEINDLKSRLHTSDRKKTAALLPGHSGASSSPLANGFITKEIFDTHIPSRAAPRRTRGSGDRGSLSSKPEKEPPDPFMSKRAAAPQPQGKGGVLLGLLLQQPLTPSSLGLSHLLSMSLTSSSLPTGCPRPEGAGSRDTHTPSLTQVQSLARNGLNMGHFHSAGRTCLPVDMSAVPTCLCVSSACLGALLFLPLVDFQLSECLESLRPASAAALTSVAPREQPQRQQPGFSVEDVALAALRLLHLLVSHSHEVITAKNTPFPLWPSQKSQLNALLPSLLRLCEGGLGGSVGSHVEKLGLSALKTLCVLIQRAPHSHSKSWRPVLQVTAAALSSDSRVRTVSAYVHMLVSLSDLPKLSQQLCLQHEQCVFLKLFQFIRARPDEQATQPDWVELDLQVVRLLSRMMMHGSEVRLSRQQQCQCHSEMVQTMVLVFHRQWLSLCAAGAAASVPWWLSPAASLLREALLLLHWLLLHHCSFSESCRPLLHLYDQVIPAVQDLLRGIPGRSESEEVALEEICRSDGDDPDDVHVDTVS